MTHMSTDFEVKKTIPDEFNAVTDEKCGNMYTKEVSTLTLDAPASAWADELIPQGYSDDGEMRASPGE